MSELCSDAVIGSLDDGYISLDSDAGRLLGFTSDKFARGSYLWKIGEKIYISFIESIERGNFRCLVSKIIELGLRVAIPTPIGRMQEILVKNGYEKTFEFCDMRGESVEVWYFPSAKPLDSV